MWPGTAQVLVWPQVVYFACAGLWFTALAIVCLASAEFPLRTARVPGAHATGMFAMVWMLVAMAVSPFSHRHHGAHALPQAGLPAVVLGLTMLVITAWWTAKTWSLTTSGQRAWMPLSHAVVHAIMAAMLLQMR